MSSSTNLRQDSHFFTLNLHVCVCGECVCRKHQEEEAERQIEPQLIVLMSSVL